MSNEKTIFSYRKDRLISRIRHMMYAWRFGRKVGAQSVVLWLPTSRKYIPDDGTDFDISLLFDVFELNRREEFSDLTIANGRTWINHDFPIVKDVLPLDPTRSPEQTQAELYAHGNTFITEDLVGYRFDNESRWNMLSELKSLFTSLPLTPKISTQLDAVSSQLSGSPYTIVHIRRGDVMRVLRENLAKERVGDDDIHQLLRRTAPIDLYLKIIEEKKILNDSMVIVSSDDAEVARLLQKRLGTDKCRLVTEFEFKGYKIQRDFFDFLIFQRAQRIVGTKGSVYGKYASIFGSGDFVDVVFRPTPEELDKYFDDEVAKGLNVPSELLDETKIRLHTLNESLQA